MAGGFKTSFKVTVNIKTEANKTEYTTALNKLVRAATLKVQQLAATNLYGGIYARPEDPKRPRTGALVNSVYSQTGDGSVDEYQNKVQAAQSLNPKAEAAVVEFTPQGNLQGKVGVGVEYGVYMEAYMPFLEPASASVQAEMSDLFEEP